MDRQHLKPVLEHEGIRSDAYSLNGLPSQREETNPAHSTYVIDPFGFGWKVFRDDDGNESCVRVFRTEDEACGHLLDLLLRDTTTR